ncbi:MAG TPA: ABC transporter permease [Vicinamibacterales bacterium]|nr:ABC transporter permease [Vicinamibacterales bacterium]
MKRSLRSWLWRVPVEREIDDELTFHVEMRTRELVARGLDPADARRLAIARLGTLADVRRACLDEGRRRDRAVRMTQWIDELRDDVRFALRQLARSPGFACVAIATLALGIGANSAIFALVDATLLRPLPFRDPGRLVRLWERTDASAHAAASPMNIADWNERSRTVERMAGFVPSVGGMVMAGRDGTAETVPRQWITWGVFDALGVTPIAGRTFVQDDDRHHANVVVLSRSFWHSRFDSDPSVIGRRVRLDGDMYTIVGVVPDSFQLIGKSSIWALVSFTPTPALRKAHVLAVVGRLKPGATLASAASDMTSVARGLARDFPSTNRGRGVTIEPLHDALIGRDLRLTSILFLGVVGIVLLICCANVANLLMARATVRTRELAIRSAMGAGRRRIVRQLLTESLVLSAIGGALAVAVGAAIIRAAPALIPEGLLPPAITLTFDARVVAFCAAAAVLVGVIFGIAPAWQALRLSPAQTMTSDLRTTTGDSGRLRSVLVSAEVATAVLLLVGAGLLLRTLMAIDRVDPGYHAPSVLSMMVDPLGSRYPTPDALLQFFRDIDDQVKGIPNVHAVAWASTLPMGDSVIGDVPFAIAGDPVVPDAERPTADYQVVSPSFFSTVDLPIVEGRAFDEHDTLHAPPVCIVNEGFVRRYLHGRSPIGVHVLLPGPEQTPAAREIVGVARQVKQRPDETEPMIQVYVPLAQFPLDDMYLLVRPASGDASVLAGSVRAAIARVDREQLVSVRDVVTLEDLAWNAAGRQRFRAVMVGTFAALALLLAMVGVFGILAYSVQQRARDFAVRRALGASTTDVLRLVASGAMPVIGAGIVVGFGISILFGRLLATMLFGVRPLDPATLAGVAIVLTITTLASIAGPAWRAVRIDPAAILRGW